MSKPKSHNDPAGVRPLHDEADIGSGEKTPGQAETEEMIRQIPPLPRNGKDQPGQPPKSPTP